MIDNSLILAVDFKASNFYKKCEWEITFSTGRMANLER